MSKLSTSQGEAKVKLYSIGDYVYANSRGLEFISVYHDVLKEYATTNPFVITYVSVFDNGESTIYHCETVPVDDENGHEVEFNHYEVSDSPYDGELIQFQQEYESIFVSESDGHFEQKGKELGALVDRKQKAYGNAVEQTYEVVRVFMKPYLKDGVYIIPESLLRHLLLQIRVIDKQNRIFNNPDADLMDESPYKDISGYGLLGQEITSK